MKSLILLVVMAGVTAEVIDIVPCTGVDPDKCTIHEIRIDPCTKKPRCPLHRGQDANISFDFTPHFAASKLTTQAMYGTATWSGMDPDGCKATPCPLEADKRQTYSATMHIGQKLPTGKFSFNWQLFDENDNNNMCCFQASVELRKKKK